MKGNRNRNIIIIIILIVVAVIVSLYISNNSFRKYIDKNILKKDVAEVDTQKIYAPSVDPSRVIATNNNVYILRNGEMSIYDKRGVEKKKTKVSVGTPLYEVSNRYLALADRESNKIYLYEGDTQKWERSLEMPVESISVNRNGYVSVVTKNNIYRSVVVVFNEKGDELFKTYISVGYAIDTDISKDNNYLAIAEVDYTKTTATSNVKVVSIEKAEKDAEKAITNEFGLNSMIISVSFKDNGDLIAQYFDSIYNVSLDNNENTKEIYKLDSNVAFVDISAKSGICIIKKENAGIFANNYNLINVTEAGKESAISLIGDSIPKKLLLTDENIAITDGKKIMIYTLSHWNKKKYTSNKEIRDFKMSDKMLVVIYQDRLEIIEL